MKGRKEETEKKRTAVKEKKKEEKEEEERKTTTPSSSLLLPHPNRATVPSVFAACKALGGGALSVAWGSLSDEDAQKLAIERWRSSAAEEASKEAAKVRSEATKRLLALYKSTKLLEIGHDTTWKEARAALEQRAKKAAASSSSSSSLVTADEAEAEDTALFFASVAPSVALEAFEEHVRELRRSWREEKREREEERLRTERRSRDAFRDLLARRFALSTSTTTAATTTTTSTTTTTNPPPPSLSSPPFAPRCRWREARRALANEPAFLAVRENLEGSTPRELFEAALSEAEKGFEEARAALVAAAAAKGIVGVGVGVGVGVSASASSSSSSSDEERRALFDATADEVGGLAAAASPAVRALVWAELAAGGREAFWAERRGGGGGRGRKDGGGGGGGTDAKKASADKKKSPEKKMKRGRRGDDDEVDGDDEGTKKHRRARRRSAGSEEEEEEGQL